MWLSAHSRQQFQNDGAAKQKTQDFFDKLSTTDKLSLMFKKKEATLSNYRLCYKRKKFILNYEHFKIREVSPRASKPAEKGKSTDIEIFISTSKDENMGYQKRQEKNN